MMNRRRWLLIGFGSVVGTTWLATRQPPAEVLAQDVAGLQDMLEKGLKARLPEDFEYLRKVVKKVDDGELPRAMVIAVFHWVRKNKSYTKKYLVAYFAAALKEVAAKEGIDI